MKVIDLSYPIEEGMLTFPAHWHTPVEVSILGRHNLEGRETRKVTLSTHTGTHVDAPLHFITNGDSVDNIDLNKFVGKAKLIDVSNIKEVKISHIEDKLDKNIKKYVFRFGWGKFWNTKKFYEDWPFFSEEVIKFLAYEINIEFLGIDTPSPDSPNHGLGSVKDSPNHKILLSRGIVICEYMANLEKLNTEYFFLVALPLKIKGADGAPARCIAIMDNV